MYLRPEDLYGHGIDAVLDSFIIESSADEEAIMKRAAHLSFNHELTFGSTRSKHRARWVLLTIAGVLVAGGVGYVSLERFPFDAMQTASVPEVAQITAESKPAVVEAPKPPPIVKVDVAYVVRPKDTLGEIFTRLNLDVNQIPAILEVALVRDRFKPLQPGDQLTFHLENGALRSLDRRISTTEILSVVLSEKGFVAKVATIPTTTKLAHLRGTVGSTGFAAGRVAGLNAAIAQQLTNEIFGWDIDFARQVGPGDRFNVIYEQKFHGDDYLGDGNIAAAELVNDGESYRAVRYRSPDGKIDGYFSPDGQSMRKPFLRAPLDTTRVSPRPNADRPQPRVQLIPDHRGVDYLAPAGTIVQAAGDGRIKSINASGNYGISIVVAHGDNTSTFYAHLSGVERGLQPGQRIKQGDTIGYVGMSGAATAPHLHYEYRVNGTHVDPDTVGQVSTTSIPEQFRTDFQSKLAALLAALEESGDAVVTAALTR